MVHYLTHNLTQLSATFGDEPFNLVTISNYDGLIITDSALFLRFDLRPGRSPSSTVTILRIRDQQADLFVLGDSPL